MSGTEMVEWTFEIDEDIYNEACLACKAWGTTIEDVTTAFIYFSIDPDNLPLLDAFLGTNLTQEQKYKTSQQILSEVLKLAYRLEVLRKCREKES